MTAWVVWTVFAVVAVGLGIVGWQFSVRRVRFFAGFVALALVVTVTAYGLTLPAGAPPDLAGAFTRGADAVAAAFFQPLWLGHPVPAPGRAGWTVLVILLVLGYRELEAWALHWQAPVLDYSQLAEGQPSIRLDGTPQGTRTDGERHEQLAAELRFRLAAMEVRSPSILPGGTRTSALASIAEASGVTGGGLAGAVIRFLAALWPNPRRYQLQVWVEAADEAADTRVTVELSDAGSSGATITTKTITAGTLDEAACLVAGYVARQVFAQDPTTPAWCYGASDGRDLGVLQLARQQRVFVESVADVERSRLAQIKILQQVTGSDRCAGVVRYETAQLHDLGRNHVTALRLHALNREQYPRFFRGRYRLGMSLEMVANSGFTFTNPQAVRYMLDRVLGSLHRCGLIPIAECPADGILPRDRDHSGPWVLSPALNAMLLEAARTELRVVRRQLRFPVVVWATLRRRDERAVWWPQWRPRVRQGFGDGVSAAALLVAVRQRLNGADPGICGHGRALRIAAALTGDNDPIVAALTAGSDPIGAVPRKPPRRRGRAAPARVTRDQVRWLPWLRRTASWQAAYSVACLYSVLAQRGLAREERIVACLRRAADNRWSEMERAYDWISHDPDFLPLKASKRDEYPAFKKFLRDQEHRDYPRRPRERAGSGAATARSG